MGFDSLPSAALFMPLSPMGLIFGFESCAGLMAPSLWPVGCFGVAEDSSLCSGDE
jgi:hypothetical protein